MVRRNFRAVTERLNHFDGISVVFPHRFLLTMIKHEPSATCAHQGFLGESLVRMGPHGMPASDELRSRRISKPWFNAISKSENLYHRSNMQQVGTVCAMEFGKKRFIINSSERPGCAVVCKRRRPQFGHVTSTFEGDTQ